MQCFADTLPLVQLQVVVFLGPDGLFFNYQSFPIGIKFVWHWTCSQQIVRLFQMEGLGFEGQSSIWAIGNSPSADKYTIAKSQRENGPSMNRGKIVIVLMLLVGMGLASFAWWHRWQRAQPVLSNWGHEVTVSIRLGQQVELWRLADGEQAALAERISVGGHSWAVVERRDISDARGLIHARHALLQREGFAWDVAPLESKPAWGYVLRFRGERATATMALDFRNRRARLLERDREVGIEPIADGLQAFVEELMPPDDVLRTTTPATDQE